MGLEVAILGGLLAAGTVTQYEARKDAKAANKASQQAQARSASEQRAANAAEAARERRQQVREERIRRARIMQTSENTGTEGSSGEAGAIGSLSTQLFSNIGANLGRLQTAENLSIFAQQGADAQGAMFSANQKAQLGQFIVSNASTAATIGGAIAGSSIFQSPAATDSMAGSRYGSGSVFQEVS